MISERMNCRFVCAGVGCRGAASVAFSHKIADPVREPSSRTEYAPEAHARDRRFLRPKSLGALRSAVVYVGKHACDLRLMRISLGVEWCDLLAGAFPTSAKLIRGSYCGRHPVPRTRFG